MPSHPHRHCFAHGYFYAGTGNVVYVFTEGEIYQRTAVGNVAWLQFKADATRGHDWNKALIALFRGAPPAKKLTVVPAGYTDSF